MHFGLQQQPDLLNHGKMAHALVTSIVRRKHLSTRSKRKMNLCLKGADTTVATVNGVFLKGFFHSSNNNVSSLSFPLFVVLRSCWRRNSLAVTAARCMREPPGATWFRTIQRSTDHQSALHLRSTVDWEFVWFFTLLPVVFI